MKRIKLEKCVESINPIVVKKSDEETEYKVILPANIVDRKLVDLDKIEYGEVNLKKDVEDKYFLRKNDVLFQIKGTRFEAVVIEEIEEKTLASNSFLILRVDEEQILPKYLEWILNSESAKDYFERNTSGAQIKILRKNTLLEMEFALPRLEDQEELVRMITAFEKEKASTLKYLEDKEKLIEATIIERFGEVK